MSAARSIGLLIIVGVIAISKLIITGACLAIGFKLGYTIIDKISASRKKEIVQPKVEQAV